MENVSVSGEQRQRAEGPPDVANRHGGTTAKREGMPLQGQFRHPLELSEQRDPITSGLGYAIWYRALPGLTVTQAAVAQLSVPVIAAAGAVLTLGETVSARLVLAGIAVLSGVGLVLSARRRRA